jgi:hypothetical protein
VRPASRGANCDRGGINRRAAKAPASRSARASVSGPVLPLRPHPLPSGQRRRTRAGCRRGFLRASGPSPIRDQTAQGEATFLGPRTPSSCSARTRFPDVPHRARISSHGKTSGIGARGLASNLNAHELRPFRSIRPVAHLSATLGEADNSGHRIDQQVEAGVQG